MKINFVTCRADSILRDWIGHIGAPLLFLRNDSRLRWPMAITLDAAAFDKASLQVPQVSAADHRPPCAFSGLKIRPINHRRQRRMSCRGFSKRSGEENQLHAEPDQENCSNNDSVTRAHNGPPVANTCTRGPAASAIQTDIDCRKVILPTDGTRLPIVRGGDFGRSPFCRQHSSERSA
jgi:hypothetical protein